MPLTATLEDIKAYQEKVEKNKITPHNLPRCSCCQLESHFFKVHAYRERRFLIIVQMLLKAVFCTLVRFRCPSCGKTFTFYPDFATPHKHYTVPTILDFARRYVEDDQKTYEDAANTKNGAPEFLDNGKALAPSTIHRWISTLAHLWATYQAALSSSRHQKSSVYTPPTIASKKYKSQQRKQCLLRCRCFFKTRPFFKNQFHRVCNNICLHLI